VRLASLALALGALCLLAVVSPSGAVARAYIVHVCTAPPDGAAGQELELTVDPGTVGFSIRHTCDTAFSAVTQIAGGNSLTGGSTWALRAPPGTTIRTLGGIREQTPWENSDIIWEVRNGTERLERVSSTLPTSGVQYTVNSGIVFASLQCARRPCLPLPGKPSLHMEIGLRDIVVTVDDSIPPTAVVGPLGAGPVRGTINVPYVANDEGAGIAEAQLLVDGRVLASAQDANGGRCVQTFRFLAPCKPELRSSLPLNTATLRDGSHELKVLVTDGAGLTGESALASIEVRNAPVPVPAPAPGNPPPPSADSAAPVLSGVALSRKRFRVGRARTALAARAKAPVGTALRFSSSEAGTLSIAIAPAKKGDGPTATLTRSISAGPGRVPLSGRLGGRPLRPGPYRLLVSARDSAGNASQPLGLPFTILPAAQRRAPR
jgi:hypothetical protein